ncbi:MAG: hypothetical protein KKB50_18975 [Planctomycetes bacterium]|nr:hypothetical protein [Planctomycetota bacterium]
MPDQPQEPHGSERDDEVSKQREGDSTHPVCGAAMETLHCELLCANCGYREDCSDIFRP